MEPCMCGALDCASCYPGSRDRVRCERCWCICLACELTDDGICETCAEKEEKEVAK